MKIREVAEKAENLIEQGEITKQRQFHYQQAANSARTQLMSAYARMEAAASETDEEGNPTGDVSGARAEIYAAQALLESAEAGLTEVSQQLEGIGRQKMETIHEIERYEAVGESNLSKLQELQKRRFGANANAFIADLVARMNSGEQARQQLLISMGLAVAGKSYPAGGVYGGGIHSLIGKVNLSSEESGDPNVGGLISPLRGMRKIRGFVQNQFGLFKNDSEDIGNGINSEVITKMSNDESLAKITNSESEKEFATLKDLSDEIFQYASDYQAYPEKYNDVIRANGTSEDIEALKKIINNHYIREETIFHRKATLKDLGEQLANTPLEELPGKSFRFEGMMSASGTPSLPNNVSSGDVAMEIKAPAGTPALDLTKVAYFQEVIFNSPLCYIESAEKVGCNTTHLLIRLSNSKEYYSIVDELGKKKVDYRPIESQINEMTDNEIISRLCGGDNTDGSCSSVAFAYGGNMSKNNVLDFRGGESCTFFSRKETIQKVAMFPGVYSSTSKGRNDIECVNKLLESMIPGKKYYLATGSHASVVRKMDDHFEYLELQHSSNRNGWHYLDDTTLSNRFHCLRTRLFDSPNFLIDMESLSKSPEFLDILGYINTAESEQRKGALGHVK